MHHIGAKSAHGCMDLGQIKPDAPIKCISCCAWMGNGCRVPAAWRTGQADRPVAGKVGCVPPSGAWALEPGAAIDRPANEAWISALQVGVRACGAQGMAQREEDAANQDDGGSADEIGKQWINRHDRLRMVPVRSSGGRTLAWLPAAGVHGVNRDNACVCTVPDSRSRTGRLSSA